MESPTTITLMALARECKAALVLLWSRSLGIVEIETGEPSTVGTRVRATTVARWIMIPAMTELIPSGAFLEDP